MSVEHHHTEGQHLPPPERSLTDRILLRSWRPYIWILAVSMIVYGHILFFTEYTYYDDSQLIKDYYSRIDELSDIGQQFLEDAGHQAYGGNLYRPILNITFILSAQLSGTDLWAHYLMNIFLHCAACSLLFVLLTRLGLSRLTSVLVSLLVTVHPALTQSVAWISGRNDSLLTCFVLLSFLTFLHYQRRASVRFLILHLFFFALSLFTKETAIVLPLLLLLYSAITHSIKGRTLHLFLFIAGWSFIILHWQLLRQMAKIAPISDMALVFTSTISNLWILLSYFGKIFWPFELSFAPVKQDLTSLYGILAAVVLLLIILRSTKCDWKMILFGLSWFVLFLVPTFIHHPGKEYSVLFYEHRIYLPMIGIILILTGLEFSLTRIRYHRMLPLVFVVLFLSLGWCSHQHSYHFKNFFTLRQYAAETSPLDILQYSNLERMTLPTSLANLLLTHGTASDSSREEFRLHTARTRAVLIDLHQRLQRESPTAEAYHMLAIVSYGRGFLLDALQYFHRATALDSLNTSIRNNLGILYYDGRRFEEAEREWLTSIRLLPTDGVPHAHLAYLYFVQNRYDDARAYYQKALEFGINVPYGLMAEIERMRSVNNEQP